MIKPCKAEPVAIGIQDTFFLRRKFSIWCGIFFYR